MAFPDHLKDIGLPFDDAYALAVQMRISGWRLASGFWLLVVSR